MKLLHSRENPNKWELWRITDPRGVRWRISPRFEHVVDETPGQIKRGCRKVLQEGNLVVVTGELSSHGERSLSSNPNPRQRNCGGKSSAKFPVLDKSVCVYSTGVTIRIR